MAGRGIANSGRSEGRVPGVRSRILRSTRLVSVHDAFRQQPLEGCDQTNRRRGCCGVSKGWVDPVVAAPFDDPDCRSAVVCHASRRSASPRQHDSPSPLTVWTRHQTTNLGVRSSNLFGRANYLALNGPSHFAGRFAKSVSKTFSNLAMPLWAILLVRARYLSRIS
jgi:hypothetical protein